MESVARSSVRVTVESRTGEESNEGHELSRAFPDEIRDLERLFPDPEIRQLLCEVAGDLNAVDRFIGRMNTELKAERASIRAIKPDPKKFVFK